MTKDNTSDEEAELAKEVGPAEVPLAKELNEEEVFVAKEEYFTQGGRGA